MLARNGSLESTHAVGQRLHNREADLRILLQHLEEGLPLQHHQPHLARRNDRRRARAAVDQRHFSEEIARLQDA